MEYFLAVSVFGEQFITFTEKKLLFKVSGCNLFILSTFKQIHLVNQLLTFIMYLFIKCSVNKLFATTYFKKM